MAIKRGFKDENEMNEHIISEWNKVVSKKDVTWILGDITMEKGNYEILNKLNGIKKVILGNHDKPQHVSELLKYVNNVSSCKYLKDKQFDNIILSHIPIHPQELEYRWKLNIHGHVHTNTLNDSRYINVCAEVIDYKPRTLDTVKWLQENWSDNSVSCTVYYRKEDLENIKQYLAENYSTNFKTVSFLLYHGHGFVQAPYETVSEEIYNEMVKNVTPITSVEIKESDFDILDCESGACPIK